MRDIEPGDKNATKKDTDGTESMARLKWFNRPKGFGFVILDECGSDAFLHITTLQNARINALGEDARLRCIIIQSDKGAHVKQVAELVDPGQDPEPLKSEFAPGDGEDTEPFPLTGVVKWYKPDKGFGFITGDDGKKDVFIHQTCLEKHGLEILQPGMRIAMEVKLVPKGREVVSFELEPERADE